MQLSTVLPPVLVQNQQQNGSNLGKFSLKRAQGPAWPNRARTNPVSASGELREPRNEWSLSRRRTGGVFGVFWGSPGTIPVVGDAHGATGGESPALQPHPTSRSSGNAFPLASPLSRRPRSAKPTPEEVRGWAQSFDKLMKSPAGRNVFREFLRTEYSEENMLFWLACEELKTECNKHTIDEKARMIYEDYISILSPKEVRGRAPPEHGKGSCGVKVRVLGRFC